MEQSRLDELEAKVNRDERLTAAERDELLAHYDAVFAASPREVRDAIIAFVSAEYLRSFYKTEEGMGVRITRPGEKALLAAAEALAALGAEKPA